MKIPEFKGTTYEEWVEYHDLISGPEIVRLHILKYPKTMVWGKIQKEEFK